MEKTVLRIFEQRLYFVLPKQQYY